MEHYVAASHLVVCVAEVVTSDLASFRTCGGASALSMKCDPKHVGFYKFLQARGLLESITEVAVIEQVARGQCEKSFRRVLSSGIGWEDKYRVV